MNQSQPHYLLFAESQLDEVGTQQRSGIWRFILQSAETRERFEAIDREFGQSEQRLGLLAVIRGLESLEQPSRVTLVTASRYIRHGFRRGLSEWAANDWQWERFGEMIPVRNADLWQRIHCAMQYHEVKCRVWRYDGTKNNEQSEARKPNFLKRRRTITSAATTSSTTADQATDTAEVGV